MRYAKLVATLEDERDELKDCSRIHGEKSALDPTTAQRIANTMFAAGEAISSLERQLAEAREALGPFARAGECLDAYDPQFPDDAAILRASADWFMRTHGKPDAKVPADLNKPLVAGDLRRANRLLSTTRSVGEAK